MIYAVDYTGNFKHVASRFVGVHKGWQTNENAHCISIVSVSIARTMEVIEHAHYDHWIFSNTYFGIKMKARTLLKLGPLKLFC